MKVDISSIMKIILSAIFFSLVVFELEPHCSASQCQAPDNIVLDCDKLDGYQRCPSKGNIQGGASMYVNSDVPCTRMVQLFNHSEHVFNQTSGNEYLGCTGLLNNHHDRNLDISWYSPTGQRLNGSIGSIRSEGGDSQCHYSELQLSNNTNSLSNGIYSCIIVGSMVTLHHLYIGVYDHPGEAYLYPEIVIIYNVMDSDGQNTIGLNWTSTGRPLSNVDWYQDKQLLNRSTYGTIDILRDKINATYDHVITIPRHCLDIEPVTYSCKAYRCDASKITVSFQPPIPSQLYYNHSTNMLSWVIKPENGTMFIDRYLVEYVGGQCSSSVTQIDMLVERFTIKTNTSASVMINLEAGANYTFRVKSVNFINSSTWSTDLNITTITRVPAGAPKSVSATPLKSTVVRIMWEEVECLKCNGYITGYCLQLGTYGNWTSFNVSAVLSFEVWDLAPSKNYLFQVAAINEAGRGMFSITMQLFTPDLSTPFSDSPIPPDKPAVIAGAVGGIITITAVISFVIVIACVRKRCSNKQGLQCHETELAGNDYATTDGLLELVEYEALEPIIEDFPDDISANLGEYLILYVAVSGSPPFTLTWFHENESVISDRSIEVRGDGTLSIPCIEDKHAGVYRLVASNAYGSCYCELELTVESEGMELLNDAPKSMSVMIDCEPINVASLEQYIALHHSKNNGGFHHQFMCLCSPDEKLATIGALPENKNLNRYKNIYPYDNNYISLDPITDFKDVQHSYINASYINGLSQQEKYIATQAPMPHTVVDFWHMVWQENTSIIVMLCNIVEGHRVRSQHYWPPSGSQTYGPFFVHLEKEEKFADYIIRKLVVSCSDNSEPALCVTHYQFTSWPDHHMPDHAGPLLSLHRRVMSQYDSAKGGILVHCSAGVGRTGVFIALDIILEQTRKEGVIDVMGVVNKMRKQRMRMVQTVAQYIFIYDSVLESLVCGETQIVVHNLRLALKKLNVIDKETGKSGFEKQFQVLKRITPNECETGSQMSGTCSTLNRSIDFLACEQRRVTQTSYPSAVFVDGYRQKKAFIVAQGPSEDKCGDFWKMVAKHKCGTIVMISEQLEYNQDVCCTYWPVDGITNYGDISVELQSEIVTEDTVTRIFNLIQNRTNQQTQITQFQVLNWMPDGQCSNYRTITTLLKSVVEVQMKTGNNPIIVHCSDPVGRSAMFCVVMSVIERCKMDGVIDVFQVVKALRMQKHGAIQSVDQYCFIFDIVLAYLDSMEAYDNFR